MPATQYVNTTYSILTTISAATVPPPPAAAAAAATTTAKMAALYSPNIYLYEASILKLQNPTHKQTPGNPNFSKSQSKSKVGCYGAGAGAGARARSSTALNPRILEIRRPRRRPRTRTSASAVARAAVAEYKGDSEEEEEVIFFDGGTHYGDLLANLVFGLSLLWLPLTVAAVFRAMFLRYRFTSLRVTVISGLTGSDRKDFSYASVKDVQVVPRLLGQWGDIVITLTDDSKVDLRSVPRFREIADYCLYKAEQARESANKSSSRPKGFL